MIKEILFQDNFPRIAMRLLRWHLKYAVNNSAMPLACGFYITSRCNFQCEFCNIWRIKPGFQISEEETKSNIQELGQMKLVYFSFSGGEPLLVPYIFDLLSYAKKCGILYTHVVSNGFLMDNDRAKELARAKVSEISFSLDGDENEHDKRRCMKGAYQKVMEAIDHVKRYSPRTNIVLNAILDPRSPENAVSAVKKAKELKVNIKIQPINKHPSFGIKESAINSRVNLEKDRKRKLLEAIDEIQNSPCVTNTSPFLEYYKAFMFCPENLVFAKDDCIFGHHHIEFFANKIFPCLEGLDWQDGFDITNNSVKDILTSTTYRDKLEQLRKCSFCRRNYYICYYEPRLNFPIWNLIKSRLKISKINSTLHKND